ncbi:Pyruvate dehydrogenase E2 component, dihydrolipoamide acetyltransferase [[Mycoplasma] cavipharyngis]|uniref:2-oxo acid dehydrogenase subunit E2 n=1 Tax=[Mycoplasma] cavipharyngis TaxID=92757 RepID=UPI0037040645
MYQFKFADIGEGLHEGKVTQIFVKTGDKIKDGDKLFEVETDKVTSEITSPITGIVSEIKIQPEQVIHVGEVVILIDDQNQDSTSKTETVVESTPEIVVESASPKGASVVGQVVVSDEILDFSFGSKNSTTNSQSSASSSEKINLRQEKTQLKISPPLMRFAMEKGINLDLVQPNRADGIVTRKDLEDAFKLQLASSIEKTTSTTEPLKQAKPQLKISPPLMRFAMEKGINLDLVQPTRADGIVTRKDLEDALKLQSTSSEVKTTPTSTPTPTVQTTPVSQVAPTSVISKTNVTGLVAKREKASGLRLAIAKNLKNSWEKVAYTNLVIQVDVTELWNLRNSIKDPLLKTTGLKITFLPFIAKATTIALVDFPIFLAQYDEKTQELVYPDTINLGIAVDTEKGLMVPNIKNAQTKSVIDLATDIVDLAKKARSNQLKGADMSNGHFTITNYGSAGAIFGVPVIKYPEIAILGVGTIIDQVQSVAVGGSSGNRKIMYLTIAADHRWVDGATIGHFGTRIRQLLENPSLLSVY